MHSTHSAGEELQALREELRRYRTLFDAIDKGFCIVEMELDGDRPVDFYFRDVNPAFEQQTGLRDVVGRSARSLLPGLEDGWVEVLGEVARTGESIRLTDRVRDLGGRWFEVYAFRPGFPTDGHVAVLFKDVTEQQRIKRELATLHSRLESALEAAEIGTWEFDVVAGTIWGDRNLAAFYGIPEAKAAAGCSLQTYYLSMHPDDRRRVDDTLNDALENKDSYSVELRTLAADGTERHVLARGRIQRDETGRAVRCPGVVIDLTERRKLEEMVEAQARELRAAGERKDEFLAMLSHELRNPMAPIFSALHLLRQEPDPSATRRRAMEAIDRQMTHLSRLVDDLLEVSRITTGRIRLRTETLDLRDVVLRVVERVQPVLDAHHQRLSVDLGETPLWVEADLDRLQQAVGNVLHNASKYSEDETRIDLEAALEGEQATVRIRDQGLGMGSDLLPCIFELFTQADRSLDRAAGGLGIGLALVRNLVDLHGGTVEAHSDGLGHGSEFVLRFPVTGPPMREETPAESRGDELTDTPSLRVLVVEDNEDAADLMGSVLETWGHEAEVTRDGHQAVAVAAAFEPDVVLLDIGLPGMSGYDVARRFRESPRGDAMHLVAVTGYGRSSDHRLTREAGFDSHLVKPIRLESLKALLIGFAAGLESACADATG